MNNYEFEYIFIPDLIYRGEIDSLRDIKALNSELIKIKESYNLSDLRITSITESDLELIIISFPPPQKEPEALIGIIAIYSNIPPIYLTVERGKNRYFLCNINAHLDHNIISFIPIKPI